jgi:hypothetical protein
MGLLGLADRRGTADRRRRGRSPLGGRRGGQYGRAVGDTVTHFFCLFFCVCCRTVHST